MSDLSDLKCACCGEALERVRYFPRQLLTADDLAAEQAYVRQKARRHNVYLHGWGVTCGCAVEPVLDAATPTVRVCPGYAVAPQGDDILIDRCVEIEIPTGADNGPCAVRWPCPPTGPMPGTLQDGRTIAYVAVRYAECLTRPVRLHPAGCGCDETGCECSRVRDSFEVRILWQLPDSHLAARQDDLAWAAALQQPPADQGQRAGFPVPPCPACTSEPWVVLAAVELLPPKADGSPGGMLVSYLPRRVLLATQRLQVALAALA